MTSYRSRVSEAEEWAAYRTWAGLPASAREDYLKRFSTNSGIAKRWNRQLETDMAEAVLGVRSRTAKRDLFRLVENIPADLRNIVLDKMPDVAARELRKMFTRKATLKVRAVTKIDKAKAAFRRKAAPALISRPFAGFEDWDSCIEKQLSEGHDQDSAEKICGRLKADLEGKTEHYDDRPEPPANFAGDGTAIESPRSQAMPISFLQGLAVALIWQLADPMMPDKLSPNMLSAMAKGLYDSSLTLGDQPASVRDVQAALDAAAASLDQQTAAAFEPGVLDRIVLGVADHYAALVGGATITKTYLPEPIGPNWKRIRKMSGKVPQGPQSPILVSDPQPTPNPRGLTVRDAVANTLGRPRWPTGPMIRRGIEWNPLPPTIGQAMEIHTEQTSDGRTVWKVPGAPNMEFSSQKGAEAFLISSNSWPLARPVQIE